MEDNQQIKDKTKNIVQELDNWVSKRGSGRYIPEDSISSLDVNYSLQEDFGIQQVRSEISEFVEIILKKGKTGCALEIGLGNFGSTHFLWRLIFEHVITIEYQKERILNFNSNIREFYSRHVLGDNRSSFLFGYSYLPGILASVHRVLDNKRLDLLFIDGDHSYEGAYADWRLYSHYVSPGGIVAFHDAIAEIQDNGIPNLIKDLQEGAIDGIKRKFEYVVNSKGCGIAYYEKESPK